MHARLDRWTVLGMLLASLLPLTGCVLSAAHNRDAKWRKYYTKVYIDPLSKEMSVVDHFDFPCASSYKTDSKTNWLRKARCYMHSPDETPANKVELRNVIIEQYVAMVNHAYGDFEHDAVYGKAGITTGFDFINLGLTAATSVFGLAQTLGATATATQGAQHSIDTNFYNNQTAFAINKEMEALRLEELNKIRKREAQPVSCANVLSVANNTPATPPSGQEVNIDPSQLPCYSLEEALGDIQDLFLAGTMHRAIEAMSTSAANRAQAARKNLKTAPTPPAAPPAKQ